MYGMVRRLAAIATAFLMVLVVAGCSGAEKGLKFQQLDIAEIVLGGEERPSTVRDFLRNLPDGRTVDYSVDQARFQQQQNPTAAARDQVAADLAETYGHADGNWQIAQNRAIGTCAAVFGSGYVPDTKMYAKLYTNAKNIGIGPSSTDDWRALEGRCAQDLEVVLKTGGTVVLLR